MSKQESIASSTTLRGQNGLDDSILFLGHTHAGSPAGNLRPTARTRDALR